MAPYKIFMDVVLGYENQFFSGEIDYFEQISSSNILRIIEYCFAVWNA